MKKSGYSYIDPHDIEAFEQWAADEYQESFLLTDSETNGDASDSENTEDADTENPEQPDTLPILPVRGLVIYPQTAVPLTIG